MNHGAIILCGGKSTRMGRDKATLPFGPECMLQRMVRLLSEVVPVQNLVVVAANDQPLPRLPADIRITRDDRPERGPLEGLAAGLRAVPLDVDAVYATSCDVPLLVPGFVSMMFEILSQSYPTSGAEIVVPKDAEYHHPLAAVYRRTVLEAVERLLTADRLRLRFLFDEVSTREVSVAELRAVDPELLTLRNVNSQEEYRDALQLADF